MIKNHKRFAFPMIVALSLGIVFTSFPASAASKDQKFMNEHTIMINPKTQQKLDEIFDQLEEDLAKPSSFYSNILNDH